MNVSIRREVERKIVSKMVDDILAAGYRIGVSSERGYDVDEMLSGSTDKAEIMRSAFEADECHVFVQPRTGPLVKDGRVISEGYVYLVFGNDGWDVINDYTMNLEALLSGTNELVDEYAK